MMSTSIRSIVAGSLLVLCSNDAAARAAVFAVTNTNDSGSGSLRQAILDSNRAAGSNAIEIDLPAGPSPNVIMPAGQFLPPIKGPVIVRIKSGGAAVILDGSKLITPRTPAACPGAAVVYNVQADRWESTVVSGSGPNVRGYYGAGLAVHDTHDVEISGFEIRNFCVGVAVVRSHDVFIHDMTISDCHGAAGVLFTGDDGKAGQTTSSYGNSLLNSVLTDNGDGFEFTRGTHDSVLQGTTIGLTRPLPENGNAVEFASAGDRNALIGNTFTRYVDTAVAAAGADMTVRDNRFVDNEGAGLRVAGANLLIFGNTFSNNGGDALSVLGAGSRVMDNVVSGNRGRGIVVESLGVTLTRNAVYDNARLGIDVAAPVDRGGGPGAAAVLPALPRAPVLDTTSSWSADGLVINGSLVSKPGERYAIEIFASRNADRYTGDERGWGEGQRYLGTAVAVTDSSGKATFTLMLKIPDVFGDGGTAGFFTATTRDAAGSTSTFSRALALSRSKT